MTDQSRMEAATQAPSPLPWDRALVLGGEVGGALVAIAGLIALVHKALTREVRRDVTDVKRDVDGLRDTLGGVKARTDALEQLRTQDIQRVVRLETSLANVERQLDRIETGQEKAFGELSATIRGLGAARG